MLKIRLQRVGKKNSPSYRVVLAEHTAPPQGKFQEILGYYNPRKKKKSFKKERIEYWLKQGAQLSPTVFNLLIDEGVFKGVKLRTWKPKRKKKLEKAEEKPQEKPEEVPETKEEPKEKPKEEAKEKKPEKKSEKKPEEKIKEKSEEKDG